MCCGRLRRLTREKFRVPPPPPGKEKKEMGRIEPTNPGTECPECKRPLRKITSCCKTIYRCEQYPKCRYKETYDKQGVRR